MFRVPEWSRSDAPDEQPGIRRRPMRHPHAGNEWIGSLAFRSGEAPAVGLRNGNRGRGYPGGSSGNERGGGRLHPEAAEL